MPVQLQPHLRKTFYHWHVSNMIQDYHLMDTQKQTAMAHKETSEETTGRPNDYITEEQFLKNLYLFMKKRDTAIERIPHLGFKQIDLFMMFKTVKELGGYHQVTAQQLWKQVYNTLGGNPRSTSAATCTRRHYEKLLLPYECHIKGLHLNAVQQPRGFHYLDYSKGEEDGQPPAKRRAVLFPLQNPSGVVPEQHAGVFPLSPSYHKLYYPPYPYAPLPHSMLPASRPDAPPRPYLACPPPISIATERPPPISNSTDQIKDPLEHLRYLAKQYESSAGLAEPLNLSIKASGHTISTNPVSSFAPPSSNKSPKFLNKPPPLYTSQNSSVKSEAVGAVEAPSFFNSLKDSQTQNCAPPVSTNTDAIICQNYKDTTKMATKNSSPKTEESEHSLEVTDISDLLSSSTAENGGKMEIEIPLSVFNNWLLMYGPQAALHSSRQLLVREGIARSAAAESVPANLSFEIKQGETDRRPEDEDLRQNPKPVSCHYDLYNSNNSKHLPLCGNLKNAASRDVNSDNHSDVNKPYNLKGVPPDCWDLSNRGGPTLSKQLNVNSSSPHRMDWSPPTGQQDFRAPNPYVVNTELGQQRPGAEVLKLNPSPLLHLTPEEVMKLKKIISNSA